MKINSKTLILYLTIPILYTSITFILYHLLSILITHLFYITYTLIHRSIACYSLLNHVNNLLSS